MTLLKEKLWALYQAFPEKESARLERLRKIDYDFIEKKLIEAAANGMDSVEFSGVNEPLKAHIRAFCIENSLRIELVPANVSYVTGSVFTVSGWSNR